MKRPKFHVLAEGFSIAATLRVSLSEEEEHADDLFDELVQEEGDGQTSATNDSLYDDGGPLRPVTPPPVPKPFPAPTAASLANEEYIFEDDGYFWDNGPLTPLTSPESSPPPLSAAAKRKIASKQHSKANKQRKIQQMAQAGVSVAPEPRPKANEKYRGQAIPIYTTADVKQARVTSTGYTGLRDKASKSSTKVDASADDTQGFKTKMDKRLYTLEELVGDGSSLGFKLINWDGVTPMPIVDIHGLILGVLVGRPAKGDWDKQCVEGVAALENARRGIQPLDPSKPLPRRGGFNTLRAGVSHGGGQTEPSNFKNTGRNLKAVDFLNGQRFFRGLAGFISSTFSNWAPNLHNLYKTELRKLYQHDQQHEQKLRAPFGAVFAATTYNLGPQTACLPHADLANLAFGWCGITALGNFDPDKGGHLVLWECGLVIRFPPGSTILLASALIHHSNTSLTHAHETRFSFTQYSAGALFRWVDNNFQTAKNYHASLTKAQLMELKEKAKQRWAYGLSLIPRFDLTTSKPFINTP